ncbi:CD40 ligand [Ambystoma mexicanum]|uniref:CD40 ligand n=1 Tax=Ambystoma mexicanum TaxID=8296 RepID=UPI0037E80840
MLGEGMSTSAAGWRRMHEPYQQTPPPPTTTGTPGTMKMLMFCLALFVIAQLIGTIVFGIYLHMKFDKVEDEMGLSEDYFFIRRLKKCMKGDDETSILNCKEVSKVRKLFLEVMQEETSTGGYSMLKDERKQSVAAHVQGQPSSTLSKTVLGWRNAGHSTMNSLTLQKDRLKVERPGLYYVYSQVTFCVSNSSAFHAPFVHYITLTRPHETDQLLIKGTSTHNSSRTPDCLQQSLHQGGLFEFQKGDAVYVSVTDASQVRYMPGYTYFGMFMI